jgi:cold shock CspA family protein
MNERCELNKKHGIVKRFLDAGYGFLVCEDFEWDVFFHVSNWRSAESPVAGQRVIFELGPAKSEGQPQQAVNVHPVDAAEGIDISTEIGALSIKGGA